MTTVTGKGIAAMQIRAQISAVKMEARGMRRRGRSLTAMLKEHFGMKRSAKHADVIAQLEVELARVHDEMMYPAEGDDRVRPC